MEKIKVLWFCEFDTDDEYKFLQKTVKVFEHSINDTGGIGGLNIKMDLDTSGNREPKIFENEVKDKVPNIILGNPFNSTIDTAKSLPTVCKIIDGKGIIFTAQDPTRKVSFPNLFTMNKDILDNRGSVAFFAKHLKPPKILFIQNSSNANKESYDRYETSIKDLGWKGSFNPFSFSNEKEEILDNLTDEIILEAERLRESSYVSKNLYSHKSKNIQPEIIRKIFNPLEEIIKDLPKNSLIASNVQFSDLITDIVDKYKSDLSLDLLHLNFSTRGEYSSVSSYYETDLNKKKYVKEIAEEQKFDELQTTAFGHLYTFISPLFLVQYALNRKDLKYKSVAKMISDLPSHLREIDGTNDTFLNSGFEFAFKNNELIPVGTFALKNIYINEIKRYESIFFEVQPSADLIDKDVMFTYLDLQRVDEVNVSEGYWVAEFELEVNSSQKNPIQYLKFWNRHALKNIWNTNLTKESTEQDRFQTKYRIVGAFDLTPEIGDFPFDTQKLRIDMSLERNIDDCILQPPIENLVDKNFLINGWKVSNMMAGTVKYKNFDRVGKKLQTHVNISKINRTEWSVLRNNNIAVLRSLIPLLVMMILSWYSSFNDIAKSASTIQLNTTVFLAGVALYFSAEKPKGARFTFIDRLFIYFYIAIGILILSEFSALINVELYNYLHLIWQVAIPGFVVVLLVQISRQITRVRNTNLK